MIAHVFSVLSPVAVLSARMPARWHLEMHITGSRRVFQQQLAKVSRTKSENHTLKMGGESFHNCPHVRWHPDANYDYSWPWRHITIAGVYTSRSFTIKNK
jgi:hypothetical protein